MPYPLFLTRKKKICLLSVLFKLVFKTILGSKAVLVSFLLSRSTEPGIADLPEVSSNMLTLFAAYGRTSLCILLIAIDSYHSASTESFIFKSESNRSRSEPQTFEPSSDQTHQSIKPYLKISNQTKLVN